MRIRSNKHSKNITKRGKNPLRKKDESGSTVGPIVLAFFLFVIVGSGTCLYLAFLRVMKSTLIDDVNIQNSFTAILQVIRVMESGSPGGRK